MVIIDSHRAINEAGDQLVKCAHAPEKPPYLLENLNCSSSQHQVALGADVASTESGLSQELTQGMCSLAEQRQHDSVDVVVS